MFVSPFIRITSQNWTRITGDKVTVCSIIPPQIVRRIRTTRYISHNLGFINHTGCGMSTTADASPLVTFGIVTDVQYADCDNKPASYDISKTRFYRNALDHIDSAFRLWENSPVPVNFALQLGDIIDGLNHVQGQSHLALKRTLARFESHDIPTFHTVGNHELYNFQRQELAELFHQSVSKTNIPEEIFTSQQSSNEDSLNSPILYYKFCPSPCVKFISLDCFDVSVLGYPKEHPRYVEAADILESHHKHNIFVEWDHEGALEGLDIRFQQMNGALGEKQLQWLEAELCESDRLGQHVVVFGHVCLYPESADWSCLLWNYNEVIACFHRHQCVIAYLSGHSHNKGYAKDNHGIHYVVFTGIVETPPDSSAFSTISLYSNRLEIVGYGHENSYTLPLTYVIHEKDKLDDFLESECTPSTFIKVQV